MPKSVEFIVEDLHERLRQSTKKAGTMLWPDFYERYEFQRLKSPRPEQIQELAKAKYGLIVGYGNAVVSVTYDQNFDNI